MTRRIFVRFVALQAQSARNHVGAQPVSSGTGAADADGMRTQRGRTSLPRVCKNFPDKKDVDVEEETEEIRRK